MSAERVVMIRRMPSGRRTSWCSRTRRRTCDEALERATGYSAAGPSSGHDLHPRLHALPALTCAASGGLPILADSG